MNVPKEICVLCGQLVILNGFTLIFEREEKKFCCGGCLSIFQLLQQLSDTNLITINSANNTNNEESFE